MRQILWHFEAYDDGDDDDDVRDNDDDDDDGDDDLGESCLFSFARMSTVWLRGQPYGIIPYDHTWPLVYPALRTLSDVHVSTLPFMNRGSYYHCTDWTPGSLPGRDNPNVEPPQAGGFPQPGKPTSWESLAPIG